MFHLTLKQIEAAIAAERLDEAMRWLVSAPARDHRDGQRLKDELVEKLIDRARRHLEQHRLVEARADAEKSRSLAGNTCAVAELLQQIVTAESALKSMRESEQRRLQEAKLYVQQGQFTLGKNLLTTGPVPSRLSAEIDRRRAFAADAEQRIRHAVDAGDFDRAIMILGSLDADVIRHRCIADAMPDWTKPMLDQAFIDLSRGRLDRAADLCKTLAAVSPAVRRLSELKKALSHCHEAFRMIQLFRFSDAEQQLAIAGQLIPEGNWIQDARQSINELNAEIMRIRSGPLALLSDHPGGFHDPSMDHALVRPLGKMKTSGEAFFGDSIGPASVDELSEPSMILRVDGLGAILMLQADRISIGSYSNSKRYDLPIQTDGPIDPMTVRRAGDDYFAESDSAFLVNDVPTRQRLLVHGDSIGYGRRGRLKFSKPVAASGSAVLQISGSALARREIRSVALMSDSLVFSGQGGHFNLAECCKPIVVFRDGLGYAIKHAVPGGQIQQLTVDQSVLIDSIRFTLNSTRSE